MVVRAGTVVAISTVAHGALIALVARCLMESAERTRAVVEPAMHAPSQPQRQPVAAVAAASIEIELLGGEREMPPAESPKPRRAGARTIAMAAAAATRLGTHGPGAESSSSGSEASHLSAESPSSGPGTDHPSPESPSSGFLRMRGPDLRLDGETAQRIASAGGAPLHEPRASGRLERRPGGRAVVSDGVATMHVDADGKATFRDNPDADANFHSPLAILDEQVREEVRTHLKKWLDDPWEGRRYGPARDLARHLQAVPGACDSWGSDLCQDPLAPDFERRLRSLKKKLGVGISGNLDITAYLHRKLVGDPYASRKLRLLDDTRDERVSIGEAKRAERAQRSAELMTRNLEALWAREANPVARRAALFELWDECGEDAAGMRARAIVIGWIRARLPDGSGDAYTADELTALDARRTSTMPFSPYAE